MFELIRFLSGQSLLFQGPDVATKNSALCANFSITWTQSFEFLFGLDKFDIPVFFPPGHLVLSSISCQPSAAGVLLDLERRDQSGLLTVGHHNDRSPQLNSAKWRAQFLSEKTLDSSIISSFDTENLDTCPESCYDAHKTITPEVLLSVRSSDFIDGSSSDLIDSCAGIKPIGTFPVDDTKDAFPPVKSNTQEVEHSPYAFIVSSDTCPVLACNSGAGHPEIDGLKDTFLLLS